MKYNTTETDKKSVYELVKEAEQDQKENILDLLKEKNYEAALDQAQEYVSRKKNKVIVLRKKEDNSYLFLEYKTRFNEIYKKEIRRKFKTLLEDSKAKIGHFTLTTSNLYFTDIITKKKNISKALNQFIIFLNRFFDKKIKYVASKEITVANSQSLHYHIHLIIFDLQYVSRASIEKIKVQWGIICKNNGLEGKYIYYKYSQDNTALQYALKYILKEFFDINLTSVILHFLKIRSYTTSEKIIKDTKGPNEARYEFLGLYNKQEAKELFGYQDPFQEPYEKSKQDDIYPESLKPETVFINS